MKIPTSCLRKAIHQLPDAPYILEQIDLIALSLDPLPNHGIQLDDLRDFIDPPILALPCPREPYVGLCIQILGAETFKAFGRERLLIPYQATYDKLTFMSRDQQRNFNFCRDVFEGLVKLGIIVDFASQIEAAMRVYIEANVDQIKRHELSLSPEGKAAALDAIAKFKAVANKQAAEEVTERRQIFNEKVPTGETQHHAWTRKAS